MNHLIKIILSTCLIAILNPVNTHGQNTALNDSLNTKLLVAAREIINKAGLCALITLDDQSIPMVRTMDPFPPESDFTVWFGTNSESRKVSQVKNNPIVTLYYQDIDASGYVVIHGKAQIVDDQEEKEKRWKDAWEAFYPNNRKGYTLIKVTPEWMEILSTPRGIVGDATTWRTPYVVFE
jgi:general stress protein 26